MTDQEALNIAEELDIMDTDLNSWEATFIESMLMTKHFTNSQKDRLTELEVRYLS